MKSILENSTNSQKNICAGVALAIKFRLEACNFIKYRIWYRCFPMNFANVCKGIPLKDKIFTGVSVRKISGFNYNRKRQIFYYEGTSSYIPLKIPECINRFNSQNSSELLLLKTSQQTKTCSKSTNVSRMSFGCLYI